MISVAHPRANGLVERYNGVIRRGLRMQLAALPGIHPKEALPDVLAGLRLLPTRIGYSPFQLLYKQTPRWPLGDVQVIGGDDGDLPEEVSEDAWWE